MARWITGLAAVCLSAAVFAGPAAAQGMFNDTGLFDFCDANTYAKNFVEVRRPADITPSTDDFGGTGHCSLKLSGTAGSAGDTWITRYQGEGTSCLTAACALASTGSPVFDAQTGFCLGASVQISQFNNAKGAGVVGLLGTEGGPGLFALIVNNGNSDRLTINVINPKTGAITQLASTNLGAAITERAWFHVGLAVSVADTPTLAGVLLNVDASVFKPDPSDSPDSPNSSLVAALRVTISPEDYGLSESGYVGIAGWAKSAKINTSVTNFFATNSCL